MGPRRTGRAAATAALVAALAMSACGGSDEDGDDGTTAAAPPSTETTSPTPTVDPGGEAAEASPEAPAREPGEVSELSEFDQQAVAGAYESYILAINRGDAAGVCATFAPGGLPASELPVDRGGCTESVRASLGTKPEGGAPAWDRTKVVDVKAVSVGDGEARVTATVTHRFSDRSYSSVEEDVVYYREIDERWAVLKPSATLYRAVGYPEPPLRAFTPPK